MHQKPFTAMPIAALYDIHGNLPALEAVLEEVRQAGVDQILVGGDVIPGPMPRKTLELLFHLDIPVKFIRGNGEVEVLAQLTGKKTGNVPEQIRGILQWTGEQLTPEEQDWIAGWPMTLRLEVDGVGEVLFCHATPENENDIFTKLTPVERLLPIFEELHVPLVVCGHTHMPFDRMIGGARVVNAGSVGMPFGEPGADWLIFGTKIEFRHTNYDFEKADEIIRETTYPQAQEFAKNNVLNPPSEWDMVNRLTQAGLK